ncbi:MAG: ribokinase [Clostridiales bacterium]|nr:ribokinase [Clostridiales bacterium]
MKRVFIVGSINTDFVISAPYVPAEGETLAGGGFFTARGGKGANQAVATRRLGGEIKMCGCVGDDLFGRETVRAFEKEGVDVSHVRTVANTPTGTAVIIVSGGENRIILDMGANACLTREDVDTFLQDAERGDIYLTQLENPIDVIGYGLRKAKEKGLFVVLNPAPANADIIPYLQYCDLITPNETEIEILGGTEKLLALTRATIVVTLGGEGYKIITEKGETKYPCMQVTAIDTTAAGDTLCGGLVARLAKGSSLLDAVEFGGRAASIACMKKGAQPSIPTYEEVKNYKT